MKDGLYTRHEVACIIADLFGGTCACDYSGNDEWLPQYCEFAETNCPNVVGVACWEQYLKHIDEKAGVEAGMIDLKMFSSEKELSILTGLDHEELWDAGFNLDDWDVGFQSDIELTRIEHDRHDTWTTPIDVAWWLVNRMDNYCVGYEHNEYKGKHYYMVYHS